MYRWTEEKDHARQGKNSTLTAEAMEKFQEKIRSAGSQHSNNKVLSGVAYTFSSLATSKVW